MLYCVQTTMNTNTVKLSLISLLVHAMCFTVVLSHIHAKDAVSLMSQSSNMAKISTSDITAKALGDLHHHIDKTGLKGASTDNGASTAARVRELDPVSAVEQTTESLGTQLHDFLMRFRIVASLFYQLA